MTTSASYQARIYRILFCFRRSRCNRQKNASRKSVMERKRVCSSERNGSASAAAIPTMTRLFMATTLSRSNRKADTNSGDRIGAARPQDV